MKHLSYTVFTTNSQKQCLTDAYVLISGQGIWLFLKALLTFLPVTTFSIFILVLYSWEVDNSWQEVS